MNRCLGRTALFPSGTQGVARKTLFQVEKGELGEKKVILLPCLRIRAQLELFFPFLDERDQVFEIHIADSFIAHRNIPPQVYKHREQKKTTPRREPSFLPH